MSSAAVILIGESAAIVILAGAALALFLCLRGANAARAGLGQERNAARNQEASALRLLRLAAEELRQAMLSLQSAAERIGKGLKENRPEDVAHYAAVAAALATELLALADDLDDYGVSLDAPRALNDEPVPLEELISGAVAAVTATLGPSSRNWWIGDAVKVLCLRADRRALQHVIMRLLVNAARSSAEGDWIYIFSEPAESGVAIIVEDEGGRLFAGDPDADAQGVGTRGMGLGLTLARALMEAHGGRLLIETAARIGTRVTLFFPAERVLG